jgi:NADP-dependent aldehyde dehydrogenase
MIEEPVGEDTGTVDQLMKNALSAFGAYKKISPVKRAGFLESIAAEIEKIKDRLVILAKEETHLPEARLYGEIARTSGQLRLFAALLKEGSWVEAVIDTSDPQRTPPKPDIRKMLVPVGPVIVFGASNFPFAFSTAGGDTASALAAGCSVVIKGHSAHAQTSSLVYAAIRAAIDLTGMPAYTVQHVLGSGATTGKELVQHPFSSAVGFTGSFTGGRALMGYSNQREIPIPVFAEMSSINPVVLFPDSLEKNGASLASALIASITLGVGQFCTNPGILLGIKGDALTAFTNVMAREIQKTIPQKMLHSGIHSSYTKGIAEMLGQKGLSVIGQSGESAGSLEGLPVVAKVSGNDFLKNDHFAEEVFGPFSLLVECQDKAQLIAVLRHLKGQLTTTLMATEKDIREFGDVIELQQGLAGRIILNNVPTGVEVCAAMVHGGPYPATSDARFTSVGTSAVKRWVRPVSFQNFSDSMLPEALKNDNPSGIMRIVNNIHTRAALH